ncbi:MAG: hypothetical protein K2Y39_14625 [Candidatus Obscuribacterales bacterium]|nr:hypothetical protein [Candidatus Obscuribacterales bacterium]
MKNLIEYKAFPWVAALAIGALMGFLVGPMVTAWTHHAALPLAWQCVLGIIATGITGLVIESALARRPVAVDPDRKPGRVDKVFGPGRIAYTVTPGKDGRIQLNVTSGGISARDFREKLVPMLKEIEGIEWGHPTEPGQVPGAQAKGLVAKPTVADEGSISGIILPEASLAKAIEQIEERLGSAVPL